MFKLNIQDIDQEAKNMAKSEIEESIANQIKECKLSILQKTKNIYKSGYESKIKDSCPAFQETSHLSNDGMTNEWRAIERIKDEVDSLEYMLENINVKGIFE